MRISGIRVLRSNRPACLYHMQDPRADKRASNKLGSSDIWTGANRERKRPSVVVVVVAYVRIIIYKIYKYVYYYMHVYYQPAAVLVLRFEAVPGHPGGWIIICLRINRCIRWSSIPTTEFVCALLYYKCVWYFTRVSFWFRQSFSIFLFECREGCWVENIGSNRGVCGREAARGTGKLCISKRVRALIYRNILNHDRHLIVPFPSANFYSYSF